MYCFWISRWNKVFKFNIFRHINAPNTDQNYVHFSNVFWILVPGIFNSSVHAKLIEVSEDEDNEEKAGSCCGVEDHGDVEDHDHREVVEDFDHGDVDDDPYLQKNASINSCDNGIGLDTDAGLEDSCHNEESSWKNRRVTLLARNLNSWFSPIFLRKYQKHFPRRFLRKLALIRFFVNDYLEEKKFECQKAKERYSNFNSSFDQIAFFNPKN